MAQGQGEQFPLLTNCKLTINSKVVVDTGKLYKLLTNELKFKIVGYDPLIIEKDDPSQIDIGKVYDGIRSLGKGRESGDETVNPNVQCNMHDVTSSTSLSQTGHTIGDHYRLVSRSNNVNSEDVTQERSCKESRSSDTAVCENFSLPYKEIISEMKIPRHDSDKVKQMRRIHDKDKERINKLTEVTEEQSQRESKLLNEMLLNFATTDTIIKDADKQIVTESAAEYLTQMSTHEQLDQTKRVSLSNKDVEFKQEVLMQDIFSSLNHSASNDIRNIKSVPEWHTLDKGKEVWERGDNESKTIKGNGHNEIASRLHQTVSLMCDTSSLCFSLDLNETTDKRNVGKTNVEEQSQYIQQVEKSADGFSAKLMKSADQQMQQEESENTYFPEMSFESNISDEMLSTETCKTKEEDMQNDNTCENIGKQGQYTCKAENVNYTRFQDAPEMHTTSLDRKILGNMCILQDGCENLKQQQQTKYTKENNFECQSVRSEHNEDMNSSSSFLVSGTYSDSKNGCCLVSNECKLNIRIYIANITELQVDCIVNAANQYLMHIGGVTKAISDAAGLTLRQECNNYTKDGRVLDVTGIFVSTGGKLAAKYVIHAVGPEWDLYDQENKHQCLTDLRHTVIRCLVEANRRGATSVALPSISAAIFRVPKELCARCYMEAVKHFDVLISVRDDNVTLQEIHFVDVDATMVDIIAECFSNNWSKQSDIDIVLKDAEFFDKHLKSASENEIRNHNRLSVEETKCASDTSTLYSVLTEDVVGAAASTTSQPLVDHLSSNQGCSSRLKRDQSDVIHSKSAVKRDQSDVSQSESALKRDQSDVSQSESALKRNQSDVSQSESALKRNQSDVSQSESALKRNQSDVSQSESALKRNQSDVSKSESALKRNQSDVSQSESALKRNQSDVSQSESALKRNQSNVSQPTGALSDETCEISSTYQIGKITLHVDSRHAFDLKADVIFTMGKPFDKLRGTCDFSIATSLKLCENVCGKENKYTYFNVSQLDGSQSRFLCEVFPEPDNMETAVEAFGNLREAILSCKKLPKTLIITSHVLYADPSNMQLQMRKKNYLHVKKVGMFAGSLYNYLDKLSKDTQEDISIFVVGSEDSLPMIMKVIESYNVKTVPSYVAAPVQTSSTCEQASSACVQTSSAYVQASSACVQTSNACDFCGQSTSVEPVTCCGKCLCKDCDQIASTCPFCQKLRKIITGNQPPGLMKVALIDDYADGYEEIDVWKIEYYFPDGTQKQCHPCPGKTYASIKRTAYLPDNDHGFQVLLRLRLAFIRNLIFTIGHSDSRNKDDVIVWDGISHKTSLHGGKRHGYPDADYLSRVTLELANQGVHLATATTLEKEQLSDFTHHVKKFRKFSD
ncbi:hypothetical protein BsWGS_01971 [Bradybaena similaris]